MTDFATLPEFGPAQPGQFDNSIRIRRHMGVHFPMAEDEFRWRAERRIRRLMATAGLQIVLAVVPVMRPRVARITIPADLRSTVAAWFG